MWQALLNLLTTLFKSKKILQKTTTKIPAKNSTLSEEETMYKYGTKSKERLASCHPDLQKLCNKVLELGIFDLTIVEGKRSLERQKKLVAEGKSKTLQSKHLTGDAVDIGIFKSNGIDWDDSKAYYVLAGLVYTIAKQENISIRWGGNWDKDQDMNDQSFMDLVHYELSDK